MGTVAGVNTRRYHGLLIASLRPPADRYSIFPRVEETVEFGGSTAELAAVQYPGTVSPQGYELLEGFSTVPYPTWRYRFGDLTIEKSLILVEGAQSVLLRYRVNRNCRIRIRVFVSFRDYHAVGHRNEALRRTVTQRSGFVSVHPYADLPELTIHHNASSFEESGVWYENHEYLRELERGLDFREDLYSPGVLHYEARANEDLRLLATLERAPGTVSGKKERFDDPLTRALDQFRITRADGKPSLIAGYPWFTDWSRDTLISLPALVAAGFAAGETRAILEFLVAERNQGILPNRFSDQGSTPEYNTVDAALWFFVAAQAYVQATGDLDFVRKTLYPAALDIIGWHRRGTFYGIGMDASDHLLRAGEQGVQLTWMDAKIGDYVVTPRIGKPVEINALWFNALQIASQWGEWAGDEAGRDDLLAEAGRVRTAFDAKFWNESAGCLYDVLTDSGPDVSLRPNQLFALSLPFPLVSGERARSIIRVVEKALLTPAGLRTLAAGDPKYRGRFEGDMRSRDSAYHQGTVWPWLFGPFVQAYLHAFEGAPEAKARCREIVDVALRLMGLCCLDSVAEVFDGDSPQRAGGCPAQLWSVAQTLLARRLVES